jgi:hypothetical protein
LNKLTTIKDRIHLNPAWQRGPVWSRPKQALLIDSILRGYDIPMIYLRETTPHTPFKFEVVDGQQRLRAVWEFLDDVYALSKDIEPIGKTKVAGKRFSELSPTLKRKIKGFRIVAAYVKGAKEPEISRLFSRMQMGVRLNPPELRNAVQTALRHAIDGTAREHPFFKESRIQAGRFKHQDLLSHAFSICFHDCAVDLKAPQLMRDYETIVNVSDYGPLMGDTHDILDFLYSVNGFASKRITQKWMFVDLFYLLYQHRKMLPQLNAAAFARSYQDFDKQRLANNAKPEKLLEGKPSAKQRQLYDYIQAFKISGGDQKNLKRRNQILKRHLSTTLV